MNSVQPGWYPAPDGRAGMRYFDGYRWIEEAEPPASPPGRGGLPTWAWVVLSVTVLLAVGAMVMVLVGPSSTESRDSSDSAPTSEPRSSSAVMPQLDLGEDAQLIEDEPGRWELWDLPSDYRTSVQSLRSRVPVGKTYLGLAWCSESVTSIVREGFTVDDTTWRWGDATDFLSVSITPAAVDKGSHSEVLVSREPNANGCVK